MAKAKASAPNTPPAKASAPAPEKTQEQAGAGETQSSANEPTIVALLVTAQIEGFRRAGRAWSKTQTRVEVTDLSEQQVIALFGEPMLDVVGVAE